MPSIEIHMNLIVMPFVVFASVLLGFLFRRSQIKRLNQKIISLENEMLHNHAEILTLQKDKVRMQSVMGDSKTPVVSIKENNNDEKVASKKHM